MKIKDPHIFPDEIFLDSTNLPGFDRHQFEGRMEKAIDKKTFFAVGVFFAVILVVFNVRVLYLQGMRGDYYFSRSERNSLRLTPSFPNRGIIYDREGEKLTWNESGSRSYSGMVGVSHILGYVGRPSEKDLEERGRFFSSALVGKDGVEKFYDEILFGKNGEKLTETDSLNNLISEIIQTPAIDGASVYFAIDAKVQSELYRIIDSLANDKGFQGGSGVILDVNDGEVLSMVSWPEYDSAVLASGGPREKIAAYNMDKRSPFLNRAISGLYAPGSIIKPLVALAALNEGVIAPEKQILSTGSISIQNPFFPELKSVFRDWKAHGWVDMRKALAVSSDVYFYEIGGGFEDQKGLGINKIEEYVKKFGFDRRTGIDLFGEEVGTIPNINIKSELGLKDATWRVGDTYNASIGQGYFHVTPIEMAVYAASLANNGNLVRPHLFLKTDGGFDEEKVFLGAADGAFGAKMERDVKINIPEKYFDIVREGMRMAVTEGTASALGTSAVRVAGKTGTAEIGAAKKYVNSWVIGFWPYEKPKYAFAVVMEKGPATNLVGAPFVMRQLLDWMGAHTPEYLKND